MARLPLDPVPNTPLLPDPTRDAIWKRWFDRLRFRTTQPGQIDHNTLDNLQGGTTDEYYHLTSAQHSAVANLGALGNNRVLYSNGSGVITTEAALGYDEGTNTLTVDNLFVADTATLGATSADTIVVNSGIVTINSNIVATRAAGALGPGTTNFRQEDYTFSGNAGGGTTSRIFRQMTVSGSNPFGTITLFRDQLTYSASANTTNILKDNYTVTVSGSGNVTNVVRLVQGNIIVSSTGSIATAEMWAIQNPTMSGSGTITTLYGSRTANLGHANITTAIGFKCDDFTASTTMRGFQSSLSSGAGKVNFYADGTADNILAGSLRIGSTVAPTVALDVTGAALISTTLGVTGNVTATADLAVNGGDITTSATTFNLLNATATTVNFAGGASAALNIGNAGGLATVAGPLRSVGNFDVNTNKFTVTASNGNTLVGGTLNVTGITTLNNKLYPSTDGAATQSAAGIYAGTGAPNNANGADGDFYFRSDGGALTTIYQRRTGAWVGLV